MIPVSFDEVNASFGAPEGSSESQVATIPAHHRVLEGGQHDGQEVVVVAWQPTGDELAAIAAGAPVFVTMFGGLAPHMLTTSFQDATHPA